jgi:NADPH-dependent 7-cyano-7-deazaguanine reductase QueF
VSKNFFESKCLITVKVPCGGLTLEDGMMDKMLEIKHFFSYFSSFVHDSGHQMYITQVKMLSI